jgi:hypothetical protein
VTQAPARDDAWLVASWPAPEAVRAVTTTRRGPGVSAPPFDSFNLGDHVGDAPDAVAANRAALRAALGLPGEPRWLDQVHGVGVATFGAQAPRERARADAAITRTPGVVLAIQTADCLPVLLATRDGTALGAAHAGWRGLGAGVLERTVAALDVDPAALIAWLGPAIGPRAYEVGAEVRDAFVAHDAAAAEAFAPTRPGHWTCDLYALARRRLRAAGVDAVFGGGECTLSDAARFYSFRRDGRTGRLATLAWIEPA